MQLEQLCADIRAAVDDLEFSRQARAKQVAYVIQAARHYQWVGIYEVQSGQISALAWTGANPPKVPVFAVTDGLSGAAVSSGQPVIVNDVGSDPRYLTTFDNTKSEMIVPVIDGAGRVVGTIDIASDQTSAFGEEDQLLLGECAKLVAGLWT